MQGRICRFEIHASQPQVLVDFYSALFGWKFTRIEPIGIWRIETGDGIGGGLIPRPCAKPGDSPAINSFICTVEVAALDRTLADALAKGAVLALPKMTVPGMGSFAYIKDPDGNLLGLLQP